MATAQAVLPKFNTFGIPVIIICFNNGILVKNTVHAVQRFRPLPEIVVVDNGSSCAETENILSELSSYVTVVRVGHNKHAHRVFRQHLPLWNSLPEYFLSLIHI